MQQRVFKGNSAGFAWTSYFWGSMLLPFNLPTGYVNLLINCQTLELLTIIVMPLNSLITDQIQDDF